MMKKADLSIQYVFLIFIAVVAVFVIVGLITKMALSSEKFMCVLTGQCNQENVLDKQTIETSDIDSFQGEIVKQAKICYERGRKGQIESAYSSAHCYVVKCVTGCRASCDDVRERIEESIGQNVDCEDFQNSDKAIIDFFYSDEKVIIK